MGARIVDSGLVGFFPVDWSVYKVSKLPNPHEEKKTSHGVSICMQGSIDLLLMTVRK